MVSSIFVAKIIGLWIFIMGIALLKNPEMIRKMADEYVKSVVSMFLGGVLALFFGIFVVAGHNVWVFGWPVILTLFGWMALIKGFTIMVFPEAFKEFSVWYLKNVNFRIFGVVYVILGGFLCMKGFF